MLRALHCNYSQYPRGAQHWTENCGVDIEMSPGQPREVVTVAAMVSVLRRGTLSTFFVWTHLTLALRWSARLVICELEVVENDFTSEIP